ncbi:MAG: sulfotransferase [Bacteroidales bacterium]|nr:sulfotransferase [Bacteroidales bacterium]
MVKYPIVIGGIGGSGTRVVAEILRIFNIYIGDDLNRPLDNLTYTLLFKRPKWYYKNRLNKRKIDTGIGIMEKSMTNNKTYSFREISFLIKSTFSMARHGHNKQKDGQGFWAFQRFFSILFNRQRDILSYSGWGWKEANSHLILENLNNHFANLKYIHTIRHGLDMAYSNNQQQLNNWGRMFGVSVPTTSEELPEASFRYWVEVNRQVLELSKTLGADKVLLLNFDNLCANPEQEIKKLIDFIGIEVSSSQLQNAITIPVVPKSKDRFKDHDISGFRKDDLEFLHALGYKST